MENNTIFNELKSNIDNFCELVYAMDNTEFYTNDISLEVRETPTSKCITAAYIYDKDHIESISYYNSDKFESIYYFPIDWKNNMSINFVEKTFTKGKDTLPATIDDYKEFNKILLTFSKKIFSSNYKKIK